jgi:hypothetical protein
MFAKRDECVVCGNDIFVTAVVFQMHSNTQPEGVAIIGWGELVTFSDSFMVELNWCQLAKCPKPSLIFPEFEILNLINGTKITVVGPYSIQNLDKSVSIYLGYAFFVILEMQMVR